MAERSEGALQVSVTLPEHPEMAEHIKEHLIQVCAAPISPNHPLKFPMKSHGMHDRWTSNGLGHGGLP